jgi:hypothetical protein
MNSRFAPFVAGVQANCHTADAKHARSMTLCTYLLEMRELYRWEHAFAQTAVLPRAEVSRWIGDREALWREYEDADYRRLPLAGGDVDPFDVEAANAALLPLGLVYGAGIGRFGKPQFFVGELVRDEWRDGVRILVAGREYARDVAPAPAAARDATVYVRQDGLRRVLWERAEAWSVKRNDGAMRAALDAYDFAADPEAALQQMAAAETETLILHELGECRAGRLLGPQWEAMLGALSDRRIETYARAARDHLADCLVTLPALVDRDAAASIHFWFANLDGVRRELAPGLRAAYAAWISGDRGTSLRASTEAGAKRWQRVCVDVLKAHAAGGDVLAPIVPF